MVVEHDHQGAPLAYETAEKVSPEITDGNGNVLWVFKVTSFSSFTFMESIHDQIKKEAPWAGFNGAILLVIFGATMAAPIGFRKNFLQ